MRISDKATLIAGVLGIAVKFLALTSGIVAIIACFTGSIVLFKIVATLAVLQAGLWIAVEYCVHCLHQDGEIEIEG